MSGGEAFRVTYELDELNRNIGYIAVHPAVPEFVVLEFADQTSRLSSYEFANHDDGSTDLTLTVANMDDEVPMNMAQLFSEAYGFCSVGERADLDLDLVKCDEDGVEPTANGFVTISFSSASR